MTEQIDGNEIICCMLRIAKDEIYNNKHIAAYKTLETLLKKIEELDE